MVKMSNQMKEIRSDIMESCDTDASVIYKKLRRINMLKEMNQSDLTTVNGGAIPFVPIIVFVAPFIIDAAVINMTGKSVSQHISDGSSAYAKSFQDNQSTTIHTRPVHDGMRP